MKTIYWMEYSS